MAVCGCTTRDPWKAVHEEAPLCGPNTVAIAQSRTCYPPPYVPAAKWTEQGWEVDGTIIQKYDVAKRIDEYLASIGFFDKQKPIKSYLNDAQQRVASNRFFIVSLKPTVVIMTPYDFGITERKSNNDLASVLNDRHLVSRYLVNGYHYGSSVPVEQDYRWFSPEFEKGIMDVSQKDGTYRIAEGSVVLTFGSTKTNKWYPITREE